MKLSRKMKIYSSLASFAVLGGVAITAASCADTSETEKNSSPTTDNKEPASSEGSGTPASTEPTTKPGEPTGTDKPLETKNPDANGETGMSSEDGKGKENSDVDNTKLETSPSVDQLGDTGAETAKPAPDQNPS